MICKQNAVTTRGTTVTRKQVCLRYLFTSLTESRVVAEEASGVEAIRLRPQLRIAVQRQRVNHHVHTLWHVNTVRIVLGSSSDDVFTVHDLGYEGEGRVHTQRF